VRAYSRWLSPGSTSHHGHHRLPERKLEARTVIHNFMKKRPDETTAAERLFHMVPQDLFSWLLGHMNELKRPVRRPEKLRGLIREFDVITASVPANRASQTRLNHQQTSALNPVETAKTFHDSWQNSFTALNGLA